jgi:hypothetical protein
MAADKTELVCMALGMTVFALAMMWCITKRKEARHESKVDGGSSKGSQGHIGGGHQKDWVTGRGGGGGWQQRLGKGCTQDSKNGRICDSWQYSVKCGR